MEYRTIKTESTSSRLEYIDVAKAIGIIAVMMSHGVGFPYNIGYYFTASYMALFFFLSGYTYKDSRTVKDNIVRRLSKIGKAYFFYSACLFIMTVASKVVLHSGLTNDYLLTAASGIIYSTHSLYYPRTVEPNISFFLVQNAPLWYLTCFIVAGGLFDVSINIAKKSGGYLGLSSLVRLQHIYLQTFQFGYLGELIQRLQVWHSDIG